MKPASARGLRKFQTPSNTLVVDSIDEAKEAFISFEGWLLHFACINVNLLYCTSNYERGILLGTYTLGQKAKIRPISNGVVLNCNFMSFLLFVLMDLCLELIRI